MKFYRVHFCSFNGVDQGYEWFTSRVDANRSVVKWKRSQRESARWEMAEAEREGCRSQAVALKTCEGLGDVEVFNIIPTKQGILGALNKHARDDMTES